MKEKGQGQKHRFQHHLIKVVKDKGTGKSHLKVDGLTSQMSKKCIWWRAEVGAGKTKTNVVLAHTMPAACRKSASMGEKESLLTKKEKTKRLQLPVSTFLCEGETTNNLSRRKSVVPEDKKKTLRRAEGKKKIR